MSDPLPLDPAEFADALAPKASKAEAVTHVQEKLLDALVSIDYAIKLRLCYGITCSQQVNERLNATAAEGIPIPCIDMLKEKPDGEMEIIMRFFAGTLLEAYKDCGAYAHELITMHHASTGQGQQYLAVRANAEKIRADGKRRIHLPGGN